MIAAGASFGWASTKVLPSGKTRCICTSSNSCPNSFDGLSPSRTACVPTQKAIIRPMALSFMSGNSSTPILQRSPRGDRPDYDGPLELFPQNFHEPCYASYIEEDFGTIAK